jgi:16S rRNA (adenine1518-N6/adenine1519-N6)-dimethyltransferase
LLHRDKIETIFIALQREFAGRIIASAGSKAFGSLSCFIQYYTEPKILFCIKKTSFFPSPKVDSCFLRLTVRQRPIIKVKDEKLFFGIIRAAFNKRRKTLRNSLKDIVPAEKLALFFSRYGINPDTRPEDLSLEDFANLSNL